MMNWRRFTSVWAYDLEYLRSLAACVVRRAGNCRFSMLQVKKAKPAGILCFISGILLLGINALVGAGFTMFTAAGEQPASGVFRSDPSPGCLRTPPNLLHTPPAATLDGPIRTSSQYTVEELVRNIFVRGGCNNISNIRAIGPNAGIGFFENGLNSIGLDRGIILSTGPISHASGPNSVTDKSGSYNYNNGDPDLDLLSGTQVRDRIGLEFDFVPLDSFVTFRYVFASEEYCEFVGSVYNDVFGFFISGPGISGPFSDNSSNIALIPGSNSFVSINSVNHQQNNAYFVRNDLPADALQCGIPTASSPYLPFVQYDGFTRQLTASLKLIPCETYHLRLVVADVGDNHYDSAVFLEAESFNIGGAVSLTGYSSVNGSVIASEGCGDGFFQFRRVDVQNRGTPITVRYSVSAAQSTAVEGVDFAPLPGIATIPAGQVSVNVPVDIYNDGIIEPLERLVLELNIPCACYSDTAVMYIADPPPLSVNTPDAGVCNGEPAQLSAVLTGGRPPFRYAWSNGANTPTQTVLPATPSHYSVSVTDGCGSTASDTAFVDIGTPPQAFLEGEAQICEGDTAFFPVSFTGSPPWSLTWSIDGITQPAAATVYQNPFMLPAIREGVYRIEQFRDAYCRGNATGEASVGVMRIGVSVAITPVTCFGDADGVISASVAGSNPPFSYSWSHGLGNGLHVEGLRAGTYFLQVTDSRGCTLLSPVEVGSPAPLEGVAFTCDDLRRPVYEFSASGGRPPYMYSVNGPGVMSDFRLFHQLQPGQRYPLLIQDASGCTLQQDWLMPARYDQMLDLPLVVRMKLGESMEISPQLHMPESLIASVEWVPAGGLSCVHCLRPVLTAASRKRYTIRVTDVFGCTAEASFALEVEHDADVFVPSAFSPNGDGTNDRLTVFANPLQINKVVSMTIYDRWGEMVYRAGNMVPNRTELGWDGTVQGRPLDPGLYVYVVQVELATGDLYTVSGETLLLK